MDPPSQASLEPPPRSAQKPTTETSTAKSAGPSSKYAKDYLEAVDLFDKEHYDACIEAIKHSMTDMNMPRYYQIKHLLLHASAEEYWYPAERKRLEAERIYMFAKYPARGNKEAEEALMSLRSSLDAIKKSQDEDRPTEVDEDRLRPDWDSEEDEDEWEEIVIEDADEEEEEGRVSMVDSRGVKGDKH